MTVILYLDLFLTANLLMNLVLLCLVNGVLKLGGKNVRILTAAAFGALAACVPIVFVSGERMLFPLAFQSEAILTLLRIFLTGFVFGGMFLIAFGRRKPGELLKISSLCSLIAAAAGGCFEFLCAGRPLRFGWFLCCSAGIYCMGKFIFSFLRKQSQREANLYEAVLYYRGKEVHVTALRDTGNQLYEPYSHHPVHVITREAADRLTNGLEHMVYIPFSAVGTRSGILPGIRIDAMELKKDGTQIRRLEKPWLAVSSQPLSGNHQYEMLLHGEEL